jgi:hypothetical protein
MFLQKVKGTKKSRFCTNMLPQSSMAVAVAAVVVVVLVVMVPEKWDRTLLIFVMGTAKSLMVVIVG